MDFQIPLIVIGVVLIASLSLVFVYKYTIKEKSYEEALAEQRQQTQALLGIKPTKPKEKKNKKPKKVKESNVKGVESEATADECEQSTVSSATDVQVTEVVSSKKQHVEFKEIEGTKTVSIKNKVKKEKVKPILVNKEETPVNEEAIMFPPNHFVTLHPKDEYELLRSNSSDELRKEVAKTTNKMESPKKIPISPKKKKADDKKDVEKMKVEEKTETLKEDKEIGKEEKPVEKKEKQIKKEEIIEVKILQNGSSTNNCVINNVKEKKKKKGDLTLQQLEGDKNGPSMNILLELVRKAELSRSEVQILIDLLLNKQHEAPNILDEWSEGKSDPVQKLKKQLAEKEKLLTEEQEALQGAQAKLREVRAEQLSERSQLQQKIRNFDELLQNKQSEIGRLHNQLQQIQVQLNDELIKQQELRHELNTIKMQRQQFEMCINQAQDNEQLIGKLRQENSELNQHNQQLRLELQRLSEENVAEKDRGQSYIIQLTNLHKELEQMNERQRQLEESRINVDQQLEKSLRQENEYKIEISRLNNVCQQQLDELRRIEHNKKQIQDELYNIQKQKDDMELLVKKLNEEKIHTNSNIEDVKIHKIEILNLTNELTSMKNLLQQTEHRCKQELELKNNIVNKLENELKEQKDKNNELRKKNWKVMEALNAAENRMKTSKGDDLKNDIKKEQDSQRLFIQRLFPDIKELNSLDPDNFYNNSEKLIKTYLTNLQNGKDVVQLESQIQHYKSTIDNAEKMLNNLQKHIQQEEINWRIQLTAKAAELDVVKEAYSQMKTKLTNLEKELEEEEDDKNRIIKEYQEFRNKTVDAGSVATIEKLTEEVNRLREQLNVEQNRNGIIDVCPKSQNCTSTNGSSLIQETEK